MNVQRIAVHIKMEIIMRILQFMYVFNVVLHACAVLGPVIYNVQYV